MKHKNRKKGEISSEIKSPSLQGIFDFEDTLEERYAKHRMKHIHGFFKDIEIPRDKYILLALILSSLGCILSLMTDLAIFRLNEPLYSGFSYSNVGLMIGAIIGVIISLIKLDHEEKRLSLIQFHFTVVSITIVLQIFLLGILPGWFTLITFGILSFTLVEGFLAFLTLFLDYSGILERGRVLAFLFIETVVVVIIISIINQAGIEVFTPLLLITILFPILTIIYIQNKKVKLEKPPLKEPVHEKRHINTRLIIYFLFIIMFSFTIGLASPVEEIEWVAAEVMNTESHQENKRLISVLLFMTLLALVVAAFVGYVFDFFGRLVTISIIIFILSLASFLNVITPEDTYIHEIIIMSLVIAVLMTVVLLVGDVTKRKNYGKILTLAITTYAVSVNIGQIVKYNIPIWISDPNQSTLVLLGLQYLSTVLCFMLLINTKETLPHKEKEWFESLFHLYLVHKSGMLIYDHDFSKESDKLESDLVSGGIIGLTTMLEEIIKGQDRLRVIDHGDRKLMFKYSPKNDVIFVLSMGEDLIVLRDKMDRFVLEFMEVYQEKVETLQYINLDEWRGVSELVEKYFSQKYFEFGQPLRRYPLRRMFRGK